MEVKAQITGTVWKIEAQVGETLEEEDEILIFESMKMEVPLCAPDSGILKELLVSEGESVEEGQVVAILEG